MGDIVPMIIETTSANEVSDDAYLLFLAEEGLDLLALYRDIADDTIRMAVLDMVRALAGPGVANLATSNRLG